MSDFFSRKRRTQNPPSPTEDSSPRTDLPVEGAVEQSSTKESSIVDVSDQAEPPEVSEQDEVEEEFAPVDVVALALKKWRTDFAEQLSEDSQTFREVRVDLGDAHPGGLAQLYADHPTRLDTLIRERTAYEDASRGLEELASRAAELERVYGRGDMHLVIGMASWEGAPSEDVPVLMRRAVVERAPDGDFTVTLQPGVEASTRLLRAIAQAGTVLDPAELGRAMHAPGGFQPRSALALIGNAGQALPGFSLKDGLVLGIFTHPAGTLYRELASSADEEMGINVRALAGDPEAVAGLEVSVPEVNPEDRDPWKELGLGDQDPATQSIIEQVAEGDSLALMVKSPGQAPRTAASAAAALVESGRTVLIVLNRKDEHSRLTSVFRSAGIESIVADLTPFGRDESIAESLGDLAQLTEAPQDDPSVVSLRANLTEARGALGDYTNLLHSEFDPWGASPFDALQVLTDLTSLGDPPKTRVRLPLPTLVQLAGDGGESGAVLLNQASQLGLFSEDSQATAWQGIIIEDAEEVGPVLGAIGRLENDLLPALRMQMSTTDAKLSLQPALTLAEWESQLTLLVRVRDCLQIFKPEVLERSPADMVVATASKQWRKDHSINVGRSELRRLQREAKDLLLPGVQVKDLNAELAKAQEIRTDWMRAVVNYEVTPTVPTQLDELLETYEKTDAELAVIKPLLEPVYGDTGTMSIDELSTVLGALYANPEGAARIPELLGIMDQLDAMGLHDLVMDLRERKVDGDNLRLELELSWWASALGFMLADEPRLGGFDPEGLESLLQRARELDELQVASLGASLVNHVLSRAVQAMEMFPEQRDQLLRGLEDGEDPASLFSRVNLAWDLKPIVIAGPAVVASLIRRGRPVDSLILLDLEGLTVGQIVPLLPRAHQVIAIQDPIRAVNAELRDALQAGLPSLEVPIERAPVSNLLSELIIRRVGEDGLPTVPSPRPPEPLTYVYVDGRGMPGPGTHVIESSKTEVQAVVDLIEKAVEVDPDQSLAVTVFSERHRNRVFSELSSRLKKNPSLAAFVAALGDPANLVVYPEQLAASPAERTIISVGYAKTPHGRIIHDFGTLSTSEGLRVMEDLALGLRGDTTLVTSIRSTDIDPSRLKKEGEQLLLDLLETAESGVAVLPPTDKDQDEAPPQLLIDLAERLHQLGLRVVPNFGVASGLQIPMAIGHPEVPSELLVAVLTDDDSYIGQPSLRVRGRHWPRMLEDQGWKTYTALSMSVFIDPNRVAKEIVQLTLDAVDEYYARNGLPRTPAAAASLGVPLEGTEGDPQDSASQAEPKGDEGAVTELDVTGAIQVIQPQLGSGDLTGSGIWLGGSEADGTPISRGPRPPYATGLPLAAYSDDQLDEFAAWILSDGVPRGEDELVEELREELAITRRGAQTEAVLRNVARRSRDS